MDNTVEKKVQVVKDKPEKKKLSTGTKVKNPIPKDKLEEFRERAQKIKEIQEEEKKDKIESLKKKDIDRSGLFHGEIEKTPYNRSVRDGKNVD